MERKTGEDSVVKETEGLGWPSQYWLLAIMGVAMGEVHAKRPYMSRRAFKLAVEKRGVELLEESFSSDRTRGRLATKAAILFVADVLLGRLNEPLEGKMFRLFVE